MCYGDIMKPTVHESQISRLEERIAYLEKHAHLAYMRGYQAGKGREKRVQQKQIAAEKERIKAFYGV